MPSGLHCCCNCICDAICVTISIPYDDDCDCDEASAEFDYDCATDSYHGTINCKGLSVDLDFSVKTCDGKCYICLTSDCLDMPYGTCPNDCQEFTPGRAFCRGTYNGRVRTGGFSATWDVDFSGCGDTYCGNGTVEIECAERVFLLCKGDCGDPLCDGCDCFCRCVCITYSDDDCTEIVKVCWDDYIGGWTVDIECPYETITITITIGPDEYNQCELSITTSIGDADPVPLLSCPDIRASWNITKADYSEASISVGCANCGECDIEIEAPCCPDDPLPLTLFATVVSGDCETVGMVIPLIHDNGIWKGDDLLSCEFDPLGNTPGPIVGIEYQFICTDDGWFVHGGCDNFADIGGALVSCNPFLFVFNDISGEACCLGCGDFDVEITE